MTKIPVKLGKPVRTCEGCTKCCEGWLSSDINGEQIYPGKPCSSVEPGVGCTIYKNRPKDPCKVFECSWKASDFVPLEFSPVVTGQIITEQNIDGVPYLAMTYAGAEVSPELVSWFSTFAVGRQLNAEWSVNGLMYAVGSADFIQARARRDALQTKELTK